LHAIFEQGERVFEQEYEVNLVEAILLAARVSQKVSDDVIQTLRLASDDLEKLTLLVGHLRRAREHADRSGNGGERVANFVSDGCGQTSHRRQPVLDAHFPLQAADFREIVKGVDAAGSFASWNDQGRNHDAERLAEAVARLETDFAVRAFGTDQRQRIEKEFVDRLADDFVTAAE